MRRGPLQAPLQHSTKRIASSGSDIDAFVDELGPQLSPGASITVAGSDEFDELTVRWTSWAAPNFQATVSVYTEEDVSSTVTFILTENYKHHQLIFQPRLKFQTSTNCLGWQSPVATEASDRLAS